MRHPLYHELRACEDEKREGVYGFPPESEAEARRRRGAFFAPTFVVCRDCGEEYEPGFDHECRRGTGNGP